jgi:hypothetical protein
MVVFRPAPVEVTSAARVDDYSPLALAATDAVPVVPADAATITPRAPFAVPLTTPAGLPVLPANGTVWRAGLLDELRNPKPKGALAERVVCADSDRDEWLRQRKGGITATDAARLATPASVRAVVNDKLYGGSFTGNAYTEYGKQREPEIQKWVLGEHGIGSCGLLIRAAENPRHLATPDGLAQCDDEVLLAEIKTTNKSWARIPRNYLRQVYWQQYVVGAERTLFVWEQHRNFVVQDAEPRAVWIERDDAEIERLVGLANEVLERLALA